MNEDIRRILEAGNSAPSGENTQPWSFKAVGATIEVHNRPERDQSLYNWGQRASYMANGAAIENMTIAASRFGYQAHVSYFPEGESSEHVATIALLKGSVQADPLFPYINKRHTNRKPYATDSLTNEQKEALVHSAAVTHVTVSLVDDPAAKERLGRVGSTNEVVMLGNKKLHQFFFSHINWNKEEDDRKKIGFFIDTLELAPPARMAFPIIKDWRVMNVLNKLGMNKSVGKQNGATNAKAGAFALLTIPNTDKQSFVEAGRTLERLWLTATSLGLSMQPLTGVLFFAYQILYGDAAAFSPSEAALIKDAYADMRSIFKVEESEVVAFMCRIGVGDSATARSSRFALEEVLE